MTRKPSKFFIFALFANAFGMESIGTYISVFGLGALFAGDPVILTMAVILDIAKVVTVSFLYQYWDRIKSKFKYYMLAAVIVLMTITSVGAFGYLSGAFQKAVQPVMEVALKVESYQHEQASLVSERDALKTEQADMDKQVAQLPSNYIRGRQRLIYSFKPEQERIRSRLNTINKRNDELTANILKVKSENIDQNVHAGPIIYVAKAFNISIEEASKWVIMILIFVFDPLAIGLLLGGNFLVKLRNEAEEPSVQFPLPGPDWTRKDDPSVDDNLFDDSIYIPDADEPVHPEVESFEEHFELPEDVEIVTTPVEALNEEVTIVTPQTYGWADHSVEVPEKEEPLTDEERHLLSLVYDDMDTGEEPIYDSWFSDPEVLSEAIKNYIPVNPIEINGDINYSGSPQADLIVEPPLKSSLDDIKIHMPEALFSNAGSSSTKKSLYE